MLDAAAPNAMDKKVGYSIACQAEVEATTAALKLQDKIPDIRAHSLLGVVAKLEIIAGADRDIDDPTDFSLAAYCFGPCRLKGNRREPAA
ncbi:hypothetical protein ACFSQQ_37995 [Mesorhizobium kowhaii]|uniref:hypothetical protein n=1 Tax=Mesorhizobium kowhaii TaxID=1300272 RepID=UPI00362A7549